VIARHLLVADGTGALIRDHGHVIALETAAMAVASASNGGRPHLRKERIPPGPRGFKAPSRGAQNEATLLSLGSR